MSTRIAEGEPINHEPLLETLASPFLPSLIEQEDLVKNVLTPIGERIACMDGLNEGVKVDRALLFLDIDAAKRQNPFLQLQGAAVLLRPENRKNPLRQALSISGLAKLLKKAAQRYLYPLRRNSFIKSGGLIIDFEEAKKLADEGDENYRQYPDIITLLGNLEPLIQPSTFSTSSQK